MNSKTTTNDFQGARESVEKIEIDDGQYCRRASNTERLLAKGADEQ